MNSWTMTTSDNSRTMATIDDARISATPMEPIITIERNGDQWSNVIVRETPLVELLERVPEDARAWYEYGPMHHSHIPYGLYCRRAAAEIRRLMELVNELTQTPPKQDKAPKTTNR